MRVPVGGCLKAQGKGSSGFGDFARLDASCANFHPARATLRYLHANRLQIRIKSSRSAIVRVRDIVAELWSFTANFATFGHFVQPPEFSGFFTGVSGILRSVVLP